MISRKVYWSNGKGTILSMGSVHEERADPERMVPMTKEQKRLKELEEENIIYRTYFRICAENETDPEKKDSTSGWRMQKTWNHSRTMS